MEKIKTIALCWLVFLFGFFGGLYVYDFRVWPYQPLKEIKHFILGHPEANVPLKEKIINDLNLKPSRYIKVVKKNSGRGLEFNDSDRGLYFREGFEFEKYKELDGLKLNPRRKGPKIFLSDRAPEGYRLIVAPFDFDDTLHGVIMLDPEGRIANVWHTSQEEVDWDHQSDTNIFPHGFEIAPDGSIVITYDNGDSLTKYDYCGNVVWRLEGRFHHSIGFEGMDAIWGWQGQSFVKIDYNTGEILKKFDLDKVMDANPDIDIFGILQDDTPSGSSWASVKGGHMHPNDIDPLPKELERHYPGFSAGDLLVCVRSPNLVFVMDQETLKVKWWRQGLARRPHDPDWNDKGTITIFNNNMNRSYSNIMEVNPVTFEYAIILSGEMYDFYTWMRGKHQKLADGGFLITSPEQGRVFETNEEGDITFEFLNTYQYNQEKQEYMEVSEARFLPKNYFKELPQCE